VSVDHSWSTAYSIADAVRNGETTARAIVEKCLAVIAERDKALNAFTDVTRDRALARAKAVDTAKTKGPLAGVPFAVKNLFDVKGLPTRAGSKINRELPPSQHDQPLIERL
jgi:Asp-tRNA(Asn)/Glu-tRNA(Gln) amidotransferase A subunit family amidase